MAFTKYWLWLPRFVKMLLIGGILGATGAGLLYVLPYSEFALYLLAGLDFCAMVMMGMGALYGVYDTLKSLRKRKNTSNDKQKEVNDEQKKE